MITLAEAGAIAAVAATIGGTVVGGVRNLGGGIDWLERRRERLRDQQSEDRAGELAWASELADALKERLAEQTELADKADDAARNHRALIAEYVVWSRAAARVLMMHRLTHLIDPPPNWQGESWPNNEPPLNG